MPESSFFRKPLGNQRVQRSQTLTKSVRRHFYPNFPLIRHKLSYKISLLVRYEILGLFGNTLILDHMYSRIIQISSRNRLKRRLSPKPKKTSQKKFLHFSNLYKILRILKKRSVSQRSILEVIDSEKCGYFRESTCSRVPNTAVICTAALLLKLSINPRQIKSENISLNQI